MLVLDTSSFHWVAQTIRLGVVRLSTIVTAELTEISTVGDDTESVDEGEWGITLFASILLLVDTTKNLGWEAQLSIERVVLLALEALSSAVVLHTAINCLEAHSLSDEVVRSTVDTLVAVLLNTTCQEGLIACTIFQEESRLALLAVSCFAELEAALLLVPLIIVAPAVVGEPVVELTLYAQIIFIVSVAALNVFHSIAYSTCREGLSLFALVQLTLDGQHKEEHAKNTRVLHHFEL